MVRKIALAVTVLGGLWLFMSCAKDVEKRYLDSQAGEDLTLSFTVGAGGQQYQGVMKLKNNWARTDFEVNGKPFSTIQSPELHIWLNHDDKTWGHQPEPPSIPPDLDAKILKERFPLEFSGRKKTIIGWECEEYVLVDLQPGDIPNHNRRQRAVAWIARDFPGGIGLQRLLERANYNVILPPIEKIIGNRLSLPGFALETEFQEGDLKGSLTFTAIKQGDLPDSIFEIPEEYLQDLSR